MLDWIERIEKASGEELDKILKAVCSRYRILYPNWELWTVSFSKSEDRNEQLDKMIQMLQRMKTLEQAGGR